MVLTMMSGCTGNAPKPDPSPAASETPPRPFTIMTTDKIKTVDPAAVADTGSTMLTENVFQRLMTQNPASPQYPKPDAAQDCSYPKRTVYECVLRPDLKFSNGDPVTSADVKFSIERALRLDVPGSSASLLDSLRRIDTPDKQTVRFVLSRYDTQFAWAVASPAASIVDSKVYESDHVQTSEDKIIGSGPFTVTSFGKDHLELAKFADYTGPDPAALSHLVIRTMPDSASIEEAMRTHETDVVWRGLSTAAQQRLQAQISTSKDQISKAGFSQLTLPGARVEQLLWNPESSHRDSSTLRAAVAGALQEDRTLDSVVPTTTPGHRASFPLGGKAHIKITWDNRIRLTLSYDPTAPNSLDLATQIRTRLEDTGGMSVLLRADDPHADLKLVDRKAWTSTGVAWLQPVIDHPMKAEAKEIASGVHKVRQAGNVGPQLASALALLQQAAAKQKTVLPISQGPEYVYVGSHAAAREPAFGPNWQLGLWGFSTKK